MVVAGECHNIGLGIYKGDDAQWENKMHRLSVNACIHEVQDKILKYNEKETINKVIMKIASKEIWFSSIK